MQNKNNVCVYEFCKFLVSFSIFIIYCTKFYHFLIYEYVYIEIIVTEMRDHYIIHEAPKYLIKYRFLNIIQTNIRSNVVLNILLHRGESLSVLRVCESHE